MLGESQQNVSKHLKTLAHAWIVVGRKDGSCTLLAARPRGNGNPLPTRPARQGRQWETIGPPLSADGDGDSAIADGRKPRSRRGFRGYYAR
jgi:hypothetical protein